MADAMDQLEWCGVAEAGLDIALCDSADNPAFPLFYAGFDRAFVLPNEKEDEEGFAACLALNHSALGADLARRYGRFAENCLIARDSETHAFVGGADFIALDLGTPAAPVISANLNYIYVDASTRRRGYFSRLIAATRHAIRQAIGHDGELLIFIEQNDPLRMSAADYERDTRFTGLDQFDRLRLWARQGARIVDHPYVQPPLDTDQAADETLVYGVLSDRPDLSACLLRDHLRGFFAISVLKGVPLEDVPVAQAQLRALDALCTAGRRIDLLDPTPFLSDVDIPASAGGAESLRAALHEAMNGRSGGDARGDGNRERQ